MTIKEITSVSKGNATAKNHQKESLNLFGYQKHDWRKVVK